MSMDIGQEDILSNNTFEPSQFLENNGIAREKIEGERAIQII